ncbi:unnamed protein product [Hyaloperonospora brassicae]|nr:unnamed protein product [Hyaloperonospora brassicae]
MGSHDATSAKLLLSFRTLKNALQSTRINDDEEAVLVTRMCVNPRYVDEFERLLRLILKTTHTAGHVSTCVVRPPPGEFTYTSIVKYSNLHVMRQTYPSSIEDGVEFYNLLAARDSLLLGPPMYQLEAGIFGTWIESDGNTKPMWGDDPEEDASCLVHQQRVPGPYCNDSCENPRGLSVRASFVAPTKTFQLFRQRYQRNNKKGGQKNLRCFPCCRNGRHVSSGFCGDSIKVHVAVTRVTESGGVKICPIHTTRPGVLAFARFLNLDGAFDPTVSGPEVVPGQTIEKTNVLAWVRDKQHPMSPLFPGILRGAAMETLSQSAIFEFNAECKAWHYGWTAPRGQGLSGNDTRHVLEVLFMKPMGSYMYCLERLRSDGFSIYSSRRANPAAIKPEVDAFDKQELGDKRNHKRKRMAHAENADLTPLGVPVMPQSPASPVSTIALSCPISSPIFSPAKENMKNGRRQSVTPAMRINTVPTLSTGFVEYPSSMPDVLPFKMESMVGSVSSSPMAVCPPPSSVPVDSVSASFDYQGLQNLTCSNGLPPNESAQQQLQQQLGRQQRQLLIDQQHQQLCRHRREQEELLQHKQRLIQQLAEQMMISQQHEQQLHVNDPQGSEELQNHSLFQEEQPARRVVSTDELPWTELYSLFDPSPLSPTTTDDDPDNDEESLSSSSSSPAPFSTANVSMEFSVPSVPSVPQTVLNDLS